MQLFGKRIFEQQQEKTARNVRGETGYRLRAVAVVMLTLAAGSPYGFAQQIGAGATGPDKAASELPGPAPVEA